MWYTYKIYEIERKLRTTVRLGLKNKEVTERQIKYGKNIIQEGIDNEEIKPYNADILTSEIFGLACTSLLRKKSGEIKVEELYKELDRSFIQNLRKGK